MGKNVGSALDLRQVAATPSASPAAGLVSLYSKADNGIYLKTSAAIERRVLDTSTTNLDNLVIDPGFENGGLFFQFNQGSTVATIVDPANGGTKVGNILSLTGNAPNITYPPSGNGIDVVPGETYYYFHRLRKTTSGATGVVRTSFVFTLDGTAVSTTTAQDTSTAALTINVWTIVSGYVTVPAGANKMKMVVASQGIASGETYQTDDWSLRNVAGQSQTTQYTTPTSNTPYTVPVGATSLTIRCQAAGGGGGSGQRAAAALSRAGGCGGGGGGYSEFEIPTSLLPSTLYVTVGTGGAGGAANAVNSTLGTVGVGGGNSFVLSANAAASSSNTIVYAIGGVAGQGGGVGATTAAGGVGKEFGGAGGIGTAAVSGVGSSGSSGIAGGGGCGGGISAANAPFAGGAGGPSSVFLPTAVPAGSANPASGGVGLASAFALLPGSGGSGSGSSASLASGNGGAGINGGGGGGSGGVINGVASGVGGAGGNGFVEIVAHF